MIKSLLVALLTFSFIGVKLRAEVMDPKKPMPHPPFGLVQPHGEPLDVLPAPGKTRIWVFGFTECGHVCPMMMHRMTKLYNAFSDDEKAHLEIVFVTFDPVNDSMQKLSDYVEKFSDEFKAVRPTVDDISAWMGKIGLSLEQDVDAQAGERYRHSPRIVVQDDRGFLRAFWPSDIDRSVMVADLRYLQKEKAGFSGWLKKLFSQEGKQRRVSALLDSLVTMCS